MEVIDLARANGVVLLCLPPHCSHKQPLDVSFMKPLSIYYDQELEKWLRNHPGRVVTTFQVAELFGIAYTKAATAQTTINGFKKTGLFPTNRDIFEPHDFAPCQPTNIDSGKNDQLNESAFVIEVLTDLPSNKLAEKSDSQLLTLMQTPQSQPISTQESNQAVRENETMECNPNASHTHSPVASTYISPYAIAPPPKASTRPRRKPKTRRGFAAVLTSSPYKAHLHNIKKAKAKHIDIKCKKLTTLKKAKLQSKLKGAQTTTFKKSLTTTYSKQEEDAQCIYCWEKWSETSHDGMIQCTICLNWAHFKCAGIEEDDLEFVCDLC